MADKKANLIISLQDKASAGLKKISDSVGGMKSSFASFRTVAVGVAAGLTAIGAAAWSSIKSYMESESAISRLNNALKNQGQDVKTVSKDLQAYATQLQKTTTFSDEAALSAMTLLTSFGLSGDKLKQTTQAAMDLSKGLGIDLQSASMLLAKAYNGQTEALSRYGIKVDESIPKSLRFEAVMQQLNGRFGGAAAAALDTTAGRIENMGNRIDDLKERIGGQLIPVLNYWIVKFEKLISLVEKMGGAEKTEAAGRALTIESLRQQSAEIVKQAQLRAQAVGGTVQLSEAERERLRLITESINREKELLEAERESVDSAKQTAQEKINAKRAEIQGIEALEMEARNKAVATQVQKEFDDQARYAAEKAAWDAQLVGISQTTISHEDKMAKLNKVSAENRIQAATSMFSTISTLSQSKNKQLAAIGKAGAIATAMINTYQGISEAWKLGPILGPILAPLVAAAGFANVAKIQSVQMAEGGVVMPRSGGTLATIGEAGKAEAVIPLDDERSRDAIGGGIGGTNISINAGVIVADAYSVKEFAKKIDEELFHLRRNRLSVS